MHALCFPSSIHSVVYYDLGNYQGSSDILLNENIITNKYPII